MLKIITKKDIIAGLFILMGCIVYFVYSLGFTEKAARFPRFAIFITFFLTTLYTVNSYYQKMIGKKENDKINTDEVIVIEKQMNKSQKFKIFLLFFEIFLFVLFIKQIGFYISSIFFTIIFSLTLKKDNKINILKYIFLISIISVIYFIFKNIFTVNFP